jgi:hypothetical protein
VNKLKLAALLKERNEIVDKPFFLFRSNLLSRVRDIDNILNAEKAKQKAKAEVFCSSCNIPVDPHFCKALGYRAEIIEKNNVQYYCDVCFSKEVKQYVT